MRSYCNIQQVDLQETFMNKLDKQKILQTLLRTIRKDADLSQQQLATLIGKPQSFVSKYESGERRLDVLELREICLSLDLSLQEFAERLEMLINEG